jgi:hypothetical protein
MWMMRIGMRRKKTPPESRVKSSDDLWLDELRTRCAKAGARYLKAAINIQRPVCSLTMPELQGLAEAVTAEWIVAVTEKLNDADDPASSMPSREYYRGLLFGG